MSPRTAATGIAIVVGFFATCIVVSEGVPLVNTLDSSVAEIEQLFDSLVAVRIPDSVEALPMIRVGSGKSAKHVVDDRPVRLTRANAQAASGTLLAVDSYLRAMSACMFSPAVAFRFRSQDEVILALVSFECSEVIFEEPAGRRLSGRLKLGAGRGPLLAIAKSAWPENQALQALSE